MRCQTEYMTENIISLESFKFDGRNKLSKFVLKKLGTGISYEYNSKYELTGMIFYDGGRLEVDLDKKKQTRKTNKSIVSSGKFSEARLTTESKKTLRESKGRF